MLRPNPRGQLQAHLAVCTTSSNTGRAVTAGVEAQKDLLRKTLKRSSVAWILLPSCHLPS